jgi:L-threonylcarbamoyladenylate synthase
MKSETMVEISERLCRHLTAGGVVAYPTSTLPGLGCLPTKLGLNTLFTLKNRPLDQPVSIGVASVRQAEELVEIPMIAKSILSEFPQGSLTLILDAKKTLDQRIGGDRIAIRVFANPIARKLAEIVGPITATSANQSGIEPSHDVLIAANTLGLNSQFILEGICPGGHGSTILSIEKDNLEKHGFSVSIIREGVIPRADVMTWMKKMR